MPRLSQNKTLPSAITNIKIGWALKGCGQISVADAFDMSVSARLFVYDDTTLGHTDWTDSEPSFASKYFVAKNPNNIVIALLPLDGEIITGYNTIAGGVCDGMLLSEKEMCLLEFKTNVKSPNYQTILQRANDAIAQLWHTFDGIIKPRCAEKSVNIESVLSVDFHVVFDRDLEITGINAQLMDLQSEFLENNKFQLFFDNEKSFKA